MSATKDKVSVIVVTCDSLPALHACLTSLKESFNGLGHEIINVDNGSSDESPSMVRKHFPGAKVIVNQDNLGFASACNKAVQHATGDYLLFLNPDVAIDSDAIDKLIAAVRSRPDAGVVAGRMRFPNGSFQATCRNLPRIGNMLFSRGSIFSRIIRNGSAYTLPDYEATTPVPATSGTMMMIRRELFTSIGGFDTRFFVFMEDVDLCLRLDMLGHTNYFVPSAGGVHLWGHGSKAGKLQRNWYHHWAVWKYFRKHHANVVTFFLLPFALALNFILVTILPVPHPANKR